MNLSLHFSIGIRCLFILPSETLFQLLDSLFNCYRSLFDLSRPVLIIIEPFAQKNVLILELQIESRLPS